MTGRMVAAFSLLVVSALFADYTLVEFAIVNAVPRIP